tara:strand:+ start:8027 stop:10303 length:2277 start_codon:yes stop_codon:yes gene_type:complete
MAKASPPFNNFTAGELSPRLEGRTDVNKYFNGCKKLQNFLIHPHGGASRRPGTKYVNTVKTSANFTRLIPFEFNVEQAYILEFGENYFRIHKDGGTVVSGGSPVEVATVYTSAQVSEIKFTQSADVMYLVHPSHPVQKITRTSHTAWTITEVNFLRGPMQDPNTTTTTLTANGRTGSVTVTASASTFVSTDVGRLIKLHDGFAKITNFSSATSVTATVQENAEGRTELMPGYTATTIAFFEGDPSSTGLEHNDRITDTAGNFVTEGFKVGQKVTISGASNGGNNKSTAVLLVQVTADTILFSPSVDLVDEAAGQSITINGELEADNNFSLGAFSATTGHPAAVTFFEQRLVFANTTAQPQTLFFSVGGSFEDFADGIDADDALTYTIGSNQVNVIRYLTSSRVLIVGTSGGEFAVSASGSAEPLSPTNAQIKRQANYGSANIQPIQVGNVTMFVQRASRKVRELVYNFDSDSYQAPDLTVLAEHITDSGITEMAYQQEPDNIVWCVLTDGRFVGMTYRREENVVGWHEHILGGSFGSGNSVVESVAVIPGDLDEDNVYLVVKRTINGATARYIETFSNFDFGTDVEDAFFVDSGLTYSGSAATTISGLNHLEGQSVSILANGATHPNKTVSSGSITLDRSVTKAHIGLGFDSTLQTMRVDAGGTEGTAQGKIKRIHDITLRLFRTVGIQVGSSESEIDRIPFRSSADDMDTALSMFTGDKELEFRGGFDNDGFIVVKQNQPLPTTVLAIFPRLQTFDQ